MALQHLRSSTANKRPVPGNMSEGQLAMNTASGSPGLFFKDSNANLVKVGPVHVGTTAPNASPASGGTAGNSVGEQWLDTSSSRYVFKIWDGSAWRSEDGEFVNASGDVMTGALGIIAGTAGSPGLYFSGDTNTGIYSPGGDQVAISTNGVQRINIEADGDINIDGGGVFYDATNNRLGIGTASAGYTLDVNGPIRSDGTSGGLYFGGNSTTPAVGAAIHRPAADTLAFVTASTERARIDSSGRLLVGTSNSTDNIRLNQKIAVVSTGSSSYGGIAITNYGGSSAGVAPVIDLKRSAGTTDGDYTKVSQNNVLGYIVWQGADGAAWSRAAEISAIADGDWTTSGDTSDSPGALVFSTTADGASSPTEQLRITSDRYVRLASGTGGIQFGGDTAAANALDDYEEGTFTPTIVGTSTAGTATYAANGQVGRYTKIGNRVFFDIYLSWTAHTGTGDLQINGLPFTVQNTTNLNRNYSAILNVVAMTAGNLGAAFSSPNTTAVALRQVPTGGGSVATIPMDTSAQISISGCFEA